MLSLSERSYWESFSRLVHQSLPYNFPISTVAIDGSGSLQVAENIGVCYAAVYAFDSVWIPFCKEWWSVLESYGLDYLHTTEAMSFLGHFGEAASRWDGDRNAREARRDELLLVLAGLQKKHSIKGLMQIDDNRFLGEKARAVGEDAEKVAARKMVVFRELIRDLLRDVPEPIHLQLLCDDEQELAPEIYKFYGKSKVQVPEAKARLIGVAFMDDRYLPQVQLADMTAYFARVEVDRRFRRPGDPPHPVFVKLTETVAVPVNDLRIVQADVSESGDEEPPVSGAEASEPREPDEGPR